MGGSKTCPKCNGRKIGGVGFVDGVRNNVPFGEMANIPCLVCSGEGSVPSTRTYDPAAGRKLHDDRTARGFSLRGEADRLGIPVTELSRRELGVFDDASVLEAARAIVPAKLTRLARLMERLRACEIRIGDESFLGWPSRWCEGPRRMRCANDHVSTTVLKSEARGHELCLVCFEPVVATFPEDGDGPIDPWLRLWGAWFHEEIRIARFVRELRSLRSRSVRRRRRTKVRAKKKWKIIEAQVFTHLPKAVLASFREAYKGKAEVRTYGRVIKAGGARVAVTLIVVRREEKTEETER